MSPATLRTVFVPLLDGRDHDLPLSPDEVTVEQQQELAARYTGGPSWESDQAQRCSLDFARHLDQARNTIR
ncbi:hypothetical protein [Streptomyces viridosporus]|uniref:hypothetical protein n=1 Tax=Streptomyces viridosporus TaxID=67581 RepID=UPI003701FE9E